MFQDEARFGRISDTRRCWCPKPVRPLCQAMVTQEYTYAYAAVSVADGDLDTLILPHVNGDCMQLFLDEVATRHPQDRIVMVLDGAGWHQSQALTPANNLRLLTLPPYSPELNPVEAIGDVIKDRIANTLWKTLDDLEAAIGEELKPINQTAERVRSLVSHGWLVDQVNATVTKNSAITC